MAAAACSRHLSTTVGVVILLSIKLVLVEVVIVVVAIYRCHSE